MNQITFPLQPGQQGPAVADLQDALLLLISHQFIKTFPAPNRPTAEELQALAERIKLERTQSRFGDATRQLLRFFQNQQGLGDHLDGIVEATTAAALNRLLTVLGVLNSSHAFEVSGRVYSADRGNIMGSGPESCIVRVLCRARGMNSRKVIWNSCMRSRSEASIRRP